MQTAVRIVRNRDLEASWGVLRAKEPGHMRSLITWMGGPEGYINTNPGIAIESRHCAVGLMDMGPGNRQPGVHTHTMTEIYIILEGTVESIDGVGNKHIAGPLDCLYIPKGVPHGVRIVGDQHVKLLWVNDSIERWGVSVYQEGPGPHPSNNPQEPEVSLIPFLGLEPNWSAPRAKEAGFLRWHVSWVGGEGTGASYNPDRAARNNRVGLSLCVLQPANRMHDAAACGNALHVVVRGRGVVAPGGQPQVVGPQDAIFCPAGEIVDLRALDTGPLYLVRIQEPLPAA
jgi:mannose-6-phosphate isomerase-like protein (cupin superfamily)